MSEYHEYMEIEEVAALLRVSVKTVRRKVERDEIPHFYLGRLLRFDRPWVEEWIEDRKRKGHRGQPRRRSKGPLEGLRGLTDAGSGDGR